MASTGCRPRSCSGSWRADPTRAVKPVDSTAVQAGQNFPSSNPRLVALVGLGVWVGLCMIVGSYLLASHMLSLPTPAAGDPTLRQTITANRGVDQADRWLVLHVLSEDCTCSRRVLDHLLAGTRPAGVVERIVLVSEHASAAAEWGPAIRDHGFDLEVVAPDDLVARYRIESAPLLVIVDPRDEVRYMGGYTPRKHAADVRDLALIGAVRRGETVEPLPSFGCAVGRTLASR